MRIECGEEGARILGGVGRGGAREAGAQFEECGVVEDEGRALEIVGEPAEGIGVGGGEGGCGRRVQLGPLGPERGAGAGEGGGGGEAGENIEGDVGGELGDSGCGGSEGTGEGGKGDGFREKFVHAGGEGGGARFGSGFGGAVDETESGLERITTRAGRLNIPWVVRIEVP